MCDGISLNFSTDNTIRRQCVGQPYDPFLITWLYKSPSLLVSEWSSCCVSSLWAPLCWSWGLGRRSAGWSRRPWFWFQDEWSWTAHGAATLSLQQTSGGLCPWSSNCEGKPEMNLIEKLIEKQKLDGLNSLCIHLYYLSQFYANLHLILKLHSSKHTQTFWLKMSSNIIWLYLKL